MLFEEPKNPAWKSLIILLGLTFACSLFIQFFAIILVLIFSGFDTQVIDFTTGQPNPENTFVIYVLLGASSLSTFLIPALILQMIEKRQYLYFPAQPQRASLYIVLTLLFMVASGPMMALISDWNKSMNLPAGLDALENWMRTNEDNMGDLIRRIVMVDSIPLLLLNLLVMAVIPAVVEEFYFRGSLQHIFGRMFRNAHVAIWVTAIIFSAIHLQFYGFFPRMILGLIFGYALLWTNNIWIPIIGHFVNNAYVTIYAYTYAKEGKTFEELQASEVYSVPIYIASIIGCIAIGYYFYKQSNQQKLTHESKLDKDQGLY
ncbi:hypothetical protein SAMN05421877_107134 [Sphingobacterium lactis]|uniref:CAAX prenyl protease 2/Lysostaphin resistance protein A-like domain-containing protein n=2 Tax=Sphingobacterium lactis TaxID=797291 RepID=A0A1H5ZTB8_9SPHI|nr:hypothetical protein SAMN05421877_107134 [Sphingobacterium lactis]